MANRGRITVHDPQREGNYAALMAMLPFGSDGKATSPSTSRGNMEKDLSIFDAIFLKSMAVFDG